MVRLDKAEAEMRSLNMYPHRNQCCKFYVRYAEQKLNKGYTLQKVYAPMLSHSRCTCIDLATGNGQSHSARQGRREARMILLGIFSGGGGNTLFFAPVAGGNTTTYDNILILVVSAITRRFSDVLHCHTSRYRVVTFWLDRDTDDVTSGQSFHEFLAWAEEEDPLVEMPRDLHLVLGLHD